MYLISSRQKPFKSSNLEFWSSKLNKNFGRFMGIFYWVILNNYLVYKDKNLNELNNILYKILDTLVVWIKTEFKDIPKL